MLAKTKNKVYKTIFLGLMLAFPIAHFLVFWLYVNFDALLLAFKQEMNGELFYSLNNFKRLFTELSIRDSNIFLYLRNTLLFFPAGTFIGLPLSILFSYFLYKKVPGSKFFRVVFFMPSIISAVALTMLFRYVVTTTGPLGKLQEILRISPAIDFLGDEKYAIWTILFYSVWVSFGYNIVLLSSAMGRIPTEIFEAGEIDGVGMRTEFFRFVVPMIWPTISTLIILGVANMFNVIGPVLLMTGGTKDTGTLALYIYNQVKYANENVYGYATAVGLFFTVILLPVVYGVKYLLEKVGQDVQY